MKILKVSFEEEGKQLPYVMVIEEEWVDGKVVWAQCVYSSEAQIQVVVNKTFVRPYKGD